MAEAERNRVQERTRESLEHRRETGGNLGGRPQLREGRRGLVRRLRGEGKSYREAAETCGVPLATAHRCEKSQSIQRGRYFASRKFLRPENLQPFTSHCPSLWARLLTPWITPEVLQCMQLLANLTTSAKRRNRIASHKRGWHRSCDPSRLHLLPMD